MEHNSSLAVRRRRDAADRLPPNQQRVATGGVSSPPGTGMELSFRNRLSVWWGNESRPADKMGSKGNIL
jgi:hypothetical protein